MRVSAFDSSVPSLVFISYWQFYWSCCLCAYSDTFSKNGATEMNEARLHHWFTLDEFWERHGKKSFLQIEKWYAYILRLENKEPYRKSKKERHVYINKITLPVPYKDRN